MSATAKAPSKHAATNVAHYNAVGAMVPHIVALLRAESFRPLDSASRAPPPRVFADWALARCAKGGDAAAVALCKAATSVARTTPDEDGNLRDGAAVAAAEGGPPVEETAVRAALCAVRMAQCYRTAWTLCVAMKQLPALAEAVPVLLNGLGGSDGEADGEDGAKKAGGGEMRVLNFKNLYLTGVLEGWHAFEERGTAPAGGADDGNEEEDDDMNASDQEDDLENPDKSGRDEAATALALLLYLHAAQVVRRHKNQPQQPAAEQKSSARQPVRTLHARLRTAAVAARVAVHVWSGISQRVLQRPLSSWLSDSLVAAPRSNLLVAKKSAERGEEEEENDDDDAATGPEARALARSASFVINTLASAATNAVFHDHALTLRRVHIALRDAGRRGVSALVATIKGPESSVLVTERCTTLLLSKLSDDEKAALGIRSMAKDAGAAAQNDSGAKKSASTGSGEDEAMMDVETQDGADASKAKGKANGKKGDKKSAGKNKGKRKASSPDTDGKQKGGGAPNAGEGQKGAQAQAGPRVKKARTKNKGAKMVDVKA